MQYGVNSKNSKGFTLIELIVAIGIFSMVTLISVGSLVTLLDSQRKAQSLKLVMDNLNFALENMSRLVRTGSNYTCDGATSCVAGSQFSFTAQDKRGDITYGLSNGQLTSREGGSTLYLTAPEVKVESLIFRLDGVGTGDNLQPKLVILLKGYAEITKKVKSDFKIQTTISQRLSE